MSVDPTSFMGFGVDRLKEQAKYEEKKEKYQFFRNLLKLIGPKIK